MMSAQKETKVNVAKINTIKGEHNSKSEAGAEVKACKKTIIF